ncbi:MAG TPA: phosphate signaling complex protein PhoU [Candidatus Ornithoclostridium excrementipullorum]|nr:phosphate signaling complex protein PhoU [Candidatus Ornithoclostridium excrementipullorum]
MLKRYGEDLNRLFEELIKMAALATDAVRKSARALTEGDAAAAEEVVRGDDAVDGYEKEIEQNALRIIVKYQPVANDLREVTCALKMITDIERIADQAADIASLSAKIGEAVRYEKVTAMAAHVASMAESAVNAFVNGDIAAAQATIKSDDVSDALFAEIKDEMCDRLKSRPESAEKIIYVMMIAKYLERIGDHAVNIAEWAIFSVSGMYKDSRLM